MQTRPSKWLVRVTFDDGQTRYYGDTHRGAGWTSSRGNAVRYDSENEALYEGYRLKDGYGRIVDVEAVELVNPRRRF